MRAAQSEYTGCCIFVQDELTMSTCWFIWDNSAELRLIADLYTRQHVGLLPKSLVLLVSIHEGSFMIYSVDSISLDTRWTDVSLNRRRFVYTNISRYINETILASSTSSSSYHSLWNVCLFSFALLICDKKKHRRTYSTQTWIVIKWRRQRWLF